MSTNSNKSGGGGTKKQRRRVATAQIKRVIQAGEAVSGRIVRDSHALVFSKHSGGQSEVEARVESSADLDDDDSHCSDAVGIPAQHSESSSRLGETCDNPSLERSDIFKSLLFLCALLFHAMYTSYRHKLSVLTNNQIPLYVFLPWLCLSFTIGRYFDSILARFSSAQQTSRSQALSTPSSRDLNKEKPFDTATLQQQHQQIPVTKRILHKVTMGRRFGKEVKGVYPNNALKGQSRQKKNAFWSILSLDTAIKDVKELERVIRPKLIISNILMNHLLTYPDFRKRGFSHVESSLDVVRGLEVDASTQAEQTASNSSIDTSNDEDTVIGNAKLNNVHHPSFEDDDNFSYIVEPLCSFRGMDLFLSDSPEEEIWRQPLLNQ
jgi:hypothetical protein